MHISGKKKIDWMKYIPVVLIFEIVIVALLYCFKDGINGNDFWWHIKVGEWILENGTIPTEGIFSWYGMQEHIPWTAHEWLSEIIFYLIYHYMGGGGVYIFSLGLSGIFIFLLWHNAKQYSKNNLLISGLFFTLLAVACSLFFYGRPHVFSFFLLSFELKILYGFWENPASKKIYLLPLIGCLWSNLHGGSSNLSYILCLAFLVCAKLDFTIGRVYTKKLENSTFLKLLGVTVATILAILINPIGIRVLTFPYTSLGDNLMMKIISEWQAPDAKSIGAVVLYFLPILVMSIGLITEKKQIRFIDLVVMAMFLYLFFRSARFIILWYIAASFYAFRYMPECKVADITKWWEKAVTALCAVALLAFMGYNIVEISSNVKEGEMVQKVVSDEMMAYIKEDAPKRIFNDYNVGESLIYNDIEVFFDARADMYGTKDILENGLSLLLLEQANPDAETSYVDVEGLMEFYDFDGIFVLKVRPLYSYMMSHPEIYECVYEDATSGYFKRIRMGN